TQPVAPAQPAEKAPSTPIPTDKSPFLTDKAEEVAKGYGFTEGPTWVRSADGKSGFFIFCDMRENKVYRWDPTSPASGDSDAGKPVAVREPSSRALGATADTSGTIYTIYTVDTETRAVSAWSVGADGKASSPRTVADKLGGEPLGGMNDLAVSKDGTLYITHGNWFLPRGSKSPFSGVLIVRKDGTALMGVDGLDRPNGVTISPDGGTLYVTEYSAGRIQSYPVKSDGLLGEKKLFADLNALAARHGIKGRGGADGIRCDKDGNVYSTGPGGIWALSPDGKAIGHLPQQGTNLAFGGADGKTLLITTGGGVMKAAVKTPGAGW
ncbi:MAG TPA: SMP-30/gluconolactonase/LRE family protein, partial [Phycisphaerales bacterium]|nr:SMP-30/gluconolactonase/LRE family protein [Phycisphaerales bacterium]